ncbi:hypothetical protein MRX96_012476 [Rhipicephalus microplus]
MASSSASSNINSIENFCAVTGADENVAKQMLEACNGNLEMAINMHVDTDWTQPSNSHTGEAALASSSDMPPPTVTAAEDDVRPPIPPVREVLVDGPFPYGYHAPRRASYSVFDRFRDFQAETRLQEEKLLQVGRAKNRWLMVNVQNVQEFACQVLNRDVWSNSTIKSIISEHFVFWQVYQDSEEGQRYVLFYKVVDYPYVAILDPRTGEKVLSWNQVDAVKFCDAVTEFLAEHPTPDGSAVNPPTKKVKPTAKKESIVEEDEEAQMRAAIEASLRENSARTHDSASDDDQSDLETFDSDTEVGPAHTSNHSSMQVDSSPPTRGCKTKGEASNAKSDVDEWKRFLGKRVR